MRWRRIVLDSLLTAFLLACAFMLLGFALTGCQDDPPSGDDRPKPVFKMPEKGHGKEPSCHAACGNP